MMVCTEGNTNREYSFFWGGMVGFGWMEENKKSGGGDARASKPAIGDGVLWWLWMDGREQKVGRRGCEG